MKKLYFFSLCLFGIIGVGLAQPTIEVDNVTGDPGSIVSVNFKVSDFTNIVGMQFSINWDPTVLQYNSIGNITNQINDFDAQAINTDARWTNDGSIIVQWFDLGANANSVPDGTIIFTVDFTVVGGSGSSTDISISGEPRAIEVIDINEDNVGLDVVPGSFTATGQGGGATLRLIGSDETGSTGETVCVEVTTQGFTNIVGMQFSLNWDASFLQFTEVTDFNLEGLNEGTFNTDQVAEGSLVLQWNDPAVAGVTVGNGTRIFSICFRILGASGSRSVQFTNEPTEIEIVDGDENRVTFAKKDGTVTVDGGGGGSDCNVPGFALEASSENVEPGNRVCVDFKVKDFNNITSLGSSIEWNPQVLGNPTIDAINLEGLDENLFNLDQGANGVMSFVWVDPSTDGVTLADGTVIFTICFDALGSQGQSTGITFTDELTEREVSQDGVAIDFNQCDGVVSLGGSSGGLNATASQTAPSCPGESDGAINLTVSGGSSPYTFVWTRGGTQVGTGEDISNVPAGTYVVSITDATGAQTSLEVILNDPDGVEIVDVQIVDGTGSDGSIALTLSGGATPLQFSWSNGATTRDIAGLAPGTYQVTIIEANGCMLDTSFTIGGGALMVEINAQNISCNGENDGTATALPSGGMSPYTYSWSNGETGAGISGLEPGDYNVTVTDGAGNTATASVNIEEPNQLVVVVNTTPSPTGNEGTALAEVTGGTPSYTYRWNDGNPPSTTRLIINLAQGTYTVLVTDANGCQANGSGDVTESDVPCFTNRLVMTPNGDGRNDEFDISCVEGKDNELEVYNRQGELVFEATNYNNTWQGVDQDGNSLEDGPYYWVLQVRNNGVIEQHTGHITILRNLN